MLSCMFKDLPGDQAVDRVVLLDGDRWAARDPVGKLGGLGSSCKHLGSVFYSKDSYLQINNDLFFINFFHYYNLQRQEVYFW